MLIILAAQVVFFQVDYENLPAQEEAKVTQHFADAPIKVRIFVLLRYRYTIGNNLHVENMDRRESGEHVVIGREEHD